MQISEDSKRTASLSDLAGFDENHPPEPKLIDTCVHCGFCLANCPSYRVIGKEMDSPRGRIYLMDAINEGKIPLNTATTEHFDSCLGCLACVTTCPSGVQYDKLISATRHQVERNYPRSLWDKLFRKLIFSVFPYPALLRIFLIPLWFYQNLGLQKLVRATGLLKFISPRLAAMESILPKITWKSFQDNFPDLIPAQGEKRYRVGMILGCVQRLFFSPVNEATVRVLTANGCEVVIPKSQGCCAALPEHQGQTEQAKALARQMIDSFADTNVDVVIINAAGCGHTLKEYGHILADDPEYQEKAKEFAAKVKDVQEFLADVGLTAKLAPLTDQQLTLVYQDACHLLHGQKISVQPRQVLRQIPGVRLQEPLDAALCCGSAGVYNMLQPEVADELGQQKVQNLLNTGADLIASANPGCTLQISKHLLSHDKQIPIMHPMELLDYSIRGVKLKA
ncbi:heterodisulfide reductase-related iron-sulfur binding cluster [Aetokthonos hydrillicola Thurmond2011]|jgi:glycolate oxidase iron-sulfur subunit|uniref:Glycolate oxidase iron-sulfur subunit n=1 Tax=Aetokthonos hydrillicola Thurmond2011 TaxID=2712845 RepID=A0AAP5I351_9CYAN|nr:heterodisulfide reductase-related iron-sulfur binding cluster [Aetokthonos hydrillicola]MBO3458564.1 4Fe-4S dicluster domain-containing protein [Aetokthonos hydrillicola CCALA 1050]MBW4585007.1 4Fe-4S dicluster domain-containing protein [Aetokthonos hydrillicola CCALA 1050]MDR9894232.1 heterodisulfide reductase-related iron-sulfur binding cluster [Aetokthonos hydrillicola Thurmond2011]